MTSQDQFEAWAEINMPELRLQRSDLTGHFVSPATWNFFKVWSARDGEIERLQRERTDWQAACLKRGFTYCREPDDHYVLADVPEMAALLGEVLGVEVRDRENDSYGETVSDLKDQVDAGIDAFHRAYQAETERDTLKAENLALRAEVALDNKIIAERDRLLAAIPECAAHGQCVPYAIQWVKDTQTQVAELLEARDTLKAIVFDHEMGLEAAKEEIARLKGENEALRKHAERLNWIDENYSGFGTGTYFDLRLRLPCDIEDGGLIHAIDAAMSKGEQP